VKAILGLIKEISSLIPALTAEGKLVKVSDLLCEKAALTRALLSAEADDLKGENERLTARVQDLELELAKPAARSTDVEMALQNYEKETMQNRVKAMLERAKGEVKPVEPVEPVEPVPTPAPVLQPQVLPVPIPAQQKSAPALDPFIKEVTDRIAAMEREEILSREAAGLPMKRERM